MSMCAAWLPNFIAEEPSSNQTDEYAGTRDDEDDAGTRSAVGRAWAAPHLLDWSFPTRFARPLVVVVNAAIAVERFAPACGKGRLRRVISPGGDPH